MIISSLMTKSLGELRRYKQTSKGVVCAVLAVLVLVHGKERVEDVVPDVSNISENPYALQIIWKQIARYLDFELTIQMKEFNLEDMEMEECQRRADEAGIAINLFTSQQVNRSSKCAGVLFEWAHVILGLWKVHMELRDQAQLDGVETPTMLTPRQRERSFRRTSSRRLDLMAAAASVSEDPEAAKQ